MNYTITKTQCELYKIRSNKNNGIWADITISDTGKFGRIQIASDYGDWQYGWGSFSNGFKQFLCGLDKGYVAGKFGAGNHFDFDATIKSLKRTIIDLRKDEYITAEKARSAIYRSCEIEGSGPMSKDAYASEFYHSDEFDFFDPCDIPYCTSYEPGFNQFWQELWPVFINALKEEEIQ